MKALKLFFLLLILLCADTIAIIGNTNSPVILKQPTSRTVIPFSTTRFYVQADGGQPLYYQWFKEDTPILSATNNDFIILKSQLLDAGLYKIVVSNLYGSITSTPAFLNIDSNALSDALDNSQLIFNSAGESTWFKQTNIFYFGGDSAQGEVFLTNGQSFIETTIVGPGYLTFWWKLDADDGGELTVDIFKEDSLIVYDNSANDLLTTFQINGYGEVADQIILNANSVMFPLIVNYFSFTYWGQGFNGNEKMDLRFYLNDGLDGAPGTQIWDSGWFSISETQKSMVIFDEDFGLQLNTQSFTWSISTMGIETGESTGLWLYSPPTIGNNYTDYWTRTNENWDLRFSEQAPIDFEAKLGVMQINQTNILSFFGYTDWRYDYVYIPSGINTVRWTLKKGELSQRFSIQAWLDNVSYISCQNNEPIIISQPLNQKVPAGGTATFTVETVGSQPFSYQWYKNGIPLQDDGKFYGSKSNVFIINNVQSDDIDNYFVVVTNSYGASISSNVWLRTHPLAAFGNNWFGQTIIPQSATNVIQISAGGNHNLALRNDGTVVAWGCNDFGQTDVPILSNVVQIAAGELHSLALLANGTVVGWGNNDFGQISIPGNLSDVVSIAAGAYHSLALKADGTVVAWGDDSCSQVDVPNNLIGVVAIDGGYNHSVALLNNGRVVVWGGFNAMQQTSGLTNIISVAAGCDYNLALRSDGSVISWGKYFIVPLEISNIVAIDAGHDFNLALRNDGTLFVWANQTGTAQSEIVRFDQVENAIAIAEGGNHFLVLQGNGEPHFTVNPKSTRAFLTKNILFGAAAVGNQPVTYQWLFNNLPILTATNNFLVVDNLLVENSGFYTCVASNIMGIANSTVAHLTVMSPAAPLITQHPSSTNLIVNQKLILSVTASGSQPLYYQWQKDGVNLPGETNSLLIINEVNPDNVGVYNVIVNNDFGFQVSMSAIVNVLSPPIITYQPRGCDLVSGENAMLFVSVSGSEPFSFQWRKNGESLINETNSMLQLYNVTDSFAGAYDVVVSNLFGVVTSALAFITVGIPPEIVSEPSDATAIAGSNVQFSVSSTGSDPLFYQWRLNDFEIPGETNSILLIRNVSEANAGLYSVYVWNRYGSYLSVAASLTVHVPPIITEQPKDLEVESGAAAIFEVSAIGTPPLAYQWLKDSNVLIGQTNTELVIDSAGIQNGGVYSVIVSNLGGVVVSQPAKLVIKISPEFVWAYNIGGAEQDSTKVVASDSSGNLVAVCQIIGNLNINGTNIKSRGYSDVLILKYSGGGDILWLEQAGGTWNDNPTGLAIDSENSIYIAGMYEKSATFGNTNILQNGAQESGLLRSDTDIFIAKYNKDGILQWVKTAGGIGNESVTSIAIDGNGNLIVVGIYEDVTIFENQTFPSVGEQDLFIAKYTSAGNLMWVKTAGGFGKDKINSVAADDSGNIYITGSYSTGMRFGNIVLESLVQPDVFVAKYDLNGKVLWVKSFPGDDAEDGTAIAVSPSGEKIYVGGIFGVIGKSVKMTFGNNTFQSISGIDIFIVQLDSNGNPVMSDAYDYGYFDYLSSISISLQNKILLTGSTCGEICKGIVLLLDERSESANPYFLNTDEFFINNANVLSGCFTCDNSIYIGGNFVDSASFGTIYLISAGGTDGFLAKISQYSAGPPIIIGQPVDRQTLIGGNVRFQAGVIGTPPFYYQWFKNNQTIVGATNPFLEIKNATYFDEGDYYVIITNPYGSVSSRNVHLSIAIAPSIVVEPQDIQVSVGENVSMSANVEGTSPMTFNWYHNGVLIPMANSSSILLSAISIEDAGEYQLIVTNIAGCSTSRVAVLTVGMMPVIVQQPENQQTVAGISAEFSVIAKGNEPLYYQWYFNDSLLLGETNRELRLYRATTLISGEYFVTVSNPYGTATSRVVMLTVAVPPQILVQPVSQLVSLGGSVTFTVVPVDATGVNYQWFKDEKAIPMATNSTIEIQNINFADAGAYHVVLYNFIGGTRSDIASLKLQIPTLVLTDNFEDRVVTNSTSGYGRSSNVNATRQSGEPISVGKRGTNSVWMSWVVSASGIATVSLQGSSFDTLLAVYTGSSLTNLVQVAANDDAELTEKYSEVRFNATAGTEYIIAVDGLGGGGEIVMNWSMEATAARLPEIVFEPSDTNVQEGASIFFESTSASGRATVEWYFNGVLIASNLTSLTLENVTTDKVGIYQAVLKEGERVISTKPARLQINQVDGVSDPRLSSHDKFGEALERVFENYSTNPSQHSPRRIIRNQGPSRGFTGSQVFSTYGSTTDPGEPIHCGVPGGASEWFIYQAPTNGLLVIDTFGSTFDTVLAVYDVADNYPPGNYSDLRSVACNNDVSSTNTLSRVEFYATAETIYYIAVDGVGGSSGTVYLNYNLTAPPTIVNQPQNQIVMEGTNVSFSVTANGTNLTYQWRFNSVNINGGTNGTLLLTNVNSSSAGYYSVIVSNIAGMVISSNALLTINSSPMIITQPSNVVVAKGGNANLLASVLGTSPLGYQWLFNSTPISYGTSNLLSLTSVEPTASGQYKLIVTNSVGVVTSSPAYLTVVVPSNQVILTAEDTTSLITLGPASTNGVVLGYIITSAPTNGVLSGNGNLRSYAPLTNYSGSDTFKFAIYDGAYTSEQATVSLTISEVNDPPAFGLMTNIVEYENCLINFVCPAMDVETPVPNLLFSLGAGAPEGATISPSGEFLWTPSSSQIGTNPVRIIVTDTGTPPLSATQSICITVLQLKPIEITRIETTTNGLIRLLIQGRVGRTNTIESTIIFNVWTPETNIVPSVETFEWFINPLPQNKRFYRVKVRN